ncbi:hypothetical protein IQ254_16485 [Nodosilinea sp. LEGE 07088]|uniref:hypothetical protein n=1 Tax=Nodosilinea sp. LEGE 07088 TaxID=2777968 RepID=UPI00188095DB|nr:hypothetical protein [Nodosilinea sp. LEGE 07088]MBE9138771.1 hypothetical protein [Nodosilinea sp. LEGE 07088]
MSVSPGPDSLAFLATQSTTAMACKLLFDRDLYTACHVQVPDIDHRLSALYVDSQFYSFLKVVPEARKVIDVVMRLNKRDNSAAVTQTRRGYTIWAHEPNARHAPPTHKPGYGMRPVFGPKDCLILADPTAYQTCRLQVPDVSKPLMALTYNNRYYSFFKQDANANRLLDIAAKLARRGDETLLVVEPNQFILALLEPRGQLA